MNIRYLAASFIFILGSVGFAGGADPADAVLAKIDRAAAGFRGMSADLRQVAHTEVVNQDQVATGTIRMKRVRPGDTRMLVNFGQPDPKSVSLQGQTVDIYLPRTNVVQEYNLGQNSSLIEQFLLLGFGTTKADLLANNEVKYLGADPVDGRPAAELELTPKNKDVAAHVQKIEMWISPDTGLPIQHKIFQAGGDYQLFAFSNIHLEPNLPDSSLKLKLPKNVKRETPGR
jgi:outer membrane lipoprotein-sorting protein